MLPMFRQAPPEQLSLLDYRPRKFYVYVIENTVNDKVYVGKTGNLSMGDRHCPRLSGARSRRWS